MISHHMIACIITSPFKFKLKSSHFFSGFPAHIRSISRVSFSHQRSRCSLSLYFSGFLDFFQVSHDFFSSFFATDFPFTRDFPCKLDFPPIRNFSSIFSIKFHLFHLFLIFIVYAYMVKGWNPLTIYAYTIKMRKLRKN